MTEVSPRSALYFSPPWRNISELKGGMSFSCLCWSTNAGITSISINQCKTGICFLQSQGREWETNLSSAPARTEMLSVYLWEKLWVKPASSPALPQPQGRCWWKEGAAQPKIGHGPWVTALLSSRHGRAELRGRRVQRSHLGRAAQRGWSWLVRICVPKALDLLLLLCMCGEERQDLLKTCVVPEEKLWWWEGWVWSQGLKGQIIKQRLVLYDSFSN